MRTLISLFIIAFPATLLPMDAAYDYAAKPVLNFGERILPGAWLLRDKRAQQKPLPVSWDASVLAQCLIYNYGAGLAVVHPQAQCLSWVRYGRLDSPFMITSPVHLAWAMVRNLPPVHCAIDDAESALIAGLDEKDMDVKKRHHVALDTCVNIAVPLVIESVALKAPHVAASFRWWQSIHEPYAPDLTDLKWRRIIAGAYCAYAALSCFERYMLKKRARTRRYIPL